LAPLVLEVLLELEVPEVRGRAVPKEQQVPQ
jgi:hypothetical protein